MGSDAWIVGDVPRPEINVLHPTTRARLVLGSPPDVTIIDPDGERSTVIADPDSETNGAYEVKFELTKVGEYVGIVESPAPYKDVQSFTLYANPPG
jgi:hypothetical protein